MDRPWAPSFADVSCSWCCSRVSEAPLFAKDAMRSVRLDTPAYVRLWKSTKSTGLPPQLHAVVSSQFHLICALL